MANEDLRVRISTQVQGLDQVESLKNAVRQLQGAATPAAADLQKLKNAAMALGSATDRTENDLRRSINALKDVRAQLSLTDGEYKKLTRTINQYQTQLDKATGAQQRGGRASQFAQTAGAVAASGVFGGPEGLVGAGIGAFFGPGGALAGGAIGAQVGMLRQQLGGTATLAADLEKQRIALRLILKDTAEYNSALQFLAKASKDYAIPQDRLIKGFTQLAASVVGAGGNIGDTKTAFEGVTAGIRGTGRSLEDLDGALLATAQVFSKGKVSAEELRGQIGERLPGAFTLFAEAIGKTPQELDKSLERGEVSLQDFLTFAKSVLGEYGENAKIIADSPAAAGDRLQTSLKNLSESVGRLLQPIGSSFQDTFADIASYIDGAARRLANFLGLNKTSAQKSGELNNLIITQQKAIERERSKLASGVTSKEAAEYSIKEFEANIARMRAELKLMGALDKAAEQQGKAAKAGLQGQAAPTSTADSDSAAKKAAAAAERLAAEQQRYNEATAKSRIALDDAVFRNSMELVRKRYEYEQELITKQRDLWVKSQVGAARGAAGLISGFLNEMDGLSTRLLQAKDAVESAKQGLKSAQSMAATTIGASGAASAAGRYIQGGIGPRGANQYGPHFDIKRSDGGYYSRNALDAYVQVNGRPLSSGVTVPGGEYGAPRSYGGHAGRDYAFGAGAALTLTGGAKWMGSQKGSYGDAAAFMTPDGKVYKIIHGRFEGSAGAGAGAAARRDVTAEGGADVAKAGLDSANQAFAMTEQQLGRLKGIIGQGFVLDFTDQIRQQIEAQKEANFMLEYRNKLEESGMRSEFVDAELKKAEAFKEVTGQISSANQALEILEANGQGNTEQANLLRQAIEALVKLFPDLKKGIDDAAKAQAAAADKAKSFGSQFKDTFKQAYDSATNLGANLAGIATSGIDGLTNAIVNFASTGKAAFKEFAASVLKDLGAMLIKFAIFKAITGIFGGFGGGGGGGLGSVASNLNQYAPLPALANGGVMPIKRYASGGIARSPELAIYGERGPEAYVPLPDGRSIPVKMQQRNEALNRYRPMGATGTMAAEGEMAAAAGGATPGSAAIDVRYSVERINNVEYVTADQFRKGMEQSAKQGAALGERAAIRRLQYSAAGRKGVGI